MRYARKLGLLAVMAMTAMAMLTSTASAQNNVILEKEFASGQANAACTNVGMNDHRPVSGNCRIRAVSQVPAELYLHETELVEHHFSSCSNVFEAVFNADGSGFIYNQILTPEEAPCFREPCDESPNPGPNEVAHRNLAWPARLYEPEANHGIKLDVTFCLRAHSHVAATEGTVGTNCPVTLNVTMNHVDHSFVVATPAGNHATGAGGASCGPVELIGSWVSAPNVAHPDDIEIMHTI